ncbi:MAG TPA: LysM peptidoglycan-binding domain-containing protein, partial [Acidimicrobiales bacterium]
MRRVRALLQMLGALVVLAGLVGGIPWALLTYSEWPITGVPTMEQVRDLPTTVVTDDALFAVLTVALWLSWALFVGSVIAEAAAQVRGHTSSVNFGGPIQRLAGRLVGSVLVSFGSFSSLASTMPVMASATPATPVEVQAGSVVTPGTVWSAAAGAGVTVSVDAQGQPVPGAPQDTNQATRTITVERGDTSWSLAEEHLGDGLRWREIWELNQHRVQPDGETWANASAPVRPGWVLVIPVTGDAADQATPASPSTSAPSTNAPVTPASTSADASDTARVTPASETTAEAPATSAQTPAQTPPPADTTATPPPSNGQGGSGHDIVVAHGDNFWDLAEAELAAEWGRAPTDAEVVPYWQQMIEANRDRLLPPEDPDLIYPEQVFVVPDVPADPLAPPPPPAAPTPQPEQTPAPTPPADDETPSSSTP